MKIILLILIGLTASCVAEERNIEKEPDSMFSSKKVYVITSEKSGVLLKDGEPLPNAKIIRVLNWSSNEVGVREEFTTDQKGVFVLATHEEELELSMLNQFVSKTRLYLEREEDANLFWYNSKMDPELHSETGGKTEDLICDITTEEVPAYVGGSGIATIMTKCRWKGVDL